MFDKWRSITGHLMIEPDRNYDFRTPVTACSVTIERKSSHESARESSNHVSVGAERAHSRNARIDCAQALFPKRSFVLEKSEKAMILFADLLMRSSRFDELYERLKVR